MKRCFKASFLVIVGCLYASCGPKDPPGFDPGYAKVQPIIQRDCGTCHNGSEEFAFTSPQQFKASAAKDELTTDGMPPPPMTISSADKEALLDYLK